MGNQLNKKSLNSIKNRLNYMSAKVGMLNDNLVNSATLRGVSLRGELNFPSFFFISLLYSGLNSTNQQNFKNLRY